MDIVDGKLGEAGKYELDLVDGKLMATVEAAGGPVKGSASLEVNGEAVWDLLLGKAKAAIPGKYDDILIDALKAAVFGK